MRVGQVGFGKWGRILAQAIDQYPGIELAAIHTRNAIVDPRYVKSIEQILTDKSIDSVIVAAPLNERPGIILRALQSGKHVLTEKPLSYNYTESSRLASLSKEMGLVLYVNYVHAHSPSISKLSNTMQNESISALRIFFGQPGQLYEAEGVDSLLLSHGLSIAYKLAGNTAIKWHMHMLNVDENGNPLAMVISADRSSRNSFLLEINVNLLYPERFRRVEAILGNSTITADLIHPGRFATSSLQTGGKVSTREMFIDQNHTLDNVFKQFERCCKGEVIDNSADAVIIDRVIEKLRVSWSKKLKR